MSSLFQIEMLPNQSNPKLNDLKKELSFLTQKELLAILIRVIKLKSENKDLLHYILFFDEKAMAYAETFKDEITKPIFDYPYQDYYLLKGLRKSKRLISKIYKITKSREAEMSLNLLILETIQSHIKNHRHRINTINFIATVMGKIEKLYDGIDEEIKLDYTQRLEDVKKWVTRLVRTGI